MDTQAQLTKGGDGSFLDAHRWIVDKFQHFCVHCLKVWQKREAVTNKHDYHENQLGPSLRQFVLIFISKNSNTNTQVELD